jgi:hypothetical protein
MVDEMASGTMGGRPQIYIKLAEMATLQNRKWRTFNDEYKLGVVM